MKISLVGIRGIRWLAAKAKIPTTVTIHLDGLDRGAIIHLVAKTMRDIGAKREIEGFRRRRITATCG